MCDHGLKGTNTAIGDLVKPVEIHEEPSEIIQILRKENLELRQALRSADREARRLKEELAQAVKLAVLGTLGANVAHELNNPLTIISAEADELLEAYENGRRAGELTEVSARNIKRAAERMRSLVDYIRQYIRRDGEAPWERLEINSLVQDALLILKPQLRQAGIEVSVNLPENLPSIWGHKVKLESVFQNLLANAKDAFEDVTDGRCKQIRIESKLMDSAFVCVVIEDNASGIPENIQDRIFEHFFTTKKAGKGTGLGLPMVAEHVSEHKGTVSVESEENIGTRFTIKFPLERRRNDR